MYTKENLLHLPQLELLYKATMYVLRAENLEIEEKHDNLFNAILDHDSIDLQDTANILYDLITQHENYTEVKLLDEILNYAQSKEINVENLDVLEQSYDFSELEIEMGTDIYLDDKLQNVIEHVIDNYVVSDLSAFKTMLDDVNWELCLYYAEQEKQFVAVFS